MRVPRICRVFVTIAVLGSAPSEAFLSLINKVNPCINKYAENQENALIKIHLDIGQVDIEKGRPKVSGQRIGIDGLLLELHGNQDAKYRHPKLPGANGPNPQLSTGAKALEVLRRGQYVDITGSRRVNLEHGAWEMIWRRNAPAGALICGFDVPEEIKRNEASLPAGRVYLTFPVWTEESLQDLRARKAKAEERAIEAIDRQNDELRMMQETGNLLMKAWHFRNACKANEDYDYSGHRSYSRMPLERDMIDLDGGLHLCSLGTVWTKKDGIFGGDQVLLGSALASTGVREDLENKSSPTERELKLVAYDGLRP